MVSRATPFTILICAALVFAPGFASAHSRIQETNSLADLARDQRVKNNEVKQPAKVYTNDDLPANPPEPSTPFLAINLPAGIVDGKSQMGSGSNAAGSEPHNEKYFHDRMNLLRANLESDKEDLASLQDEMNKHMADVVSGGRSGGTYLHPEMATNPVGAYKFWVAEDQRLRSSLESQNQKIAADEKDISDFEVQCRRENCEPGWIR